MRRHSQTKDRGRRREHGPLYSKVIVFKRFSRRGGEEERAPHIACAVWSAMREQLETIYMTGLCVRVAGVMVRAGIRRAPDLGRGEAASRTMGSRWDIRLAHVYLEVSRLHSGRARAPNATRM